ncbi:MAG: hypothetical protein HY840_00350 [Bacteroidetes bacterium]|nr:hypothetical protein [Bacteroidota bacterium]
MLPFSSRIIIFLLCAALLFIGLTHFPINILSWDVFGYYLYLPMTFIYHDLGLKDFSVVDSIIAKYHNTGTFYQANMAPTGNFIMRYGIGLSILYAPFFFIGYLIALITGFPADGFSEPYQYAIWSGCMIYSFIGIIMLRKVLLNFFEDKITSLLLVIIVLGTNYTLHSSIHGQGAMTHNFLFTLYTFILWFTIKWHETHKMKHAIMLAISCGLATIVRPPEIISLLIPALWGVYDKQTLKEKLQLLKEKGMHVTFFACIFIAICFIQLSYWKIYSGSFWYDSYYNPGEGMDLFPPHTFNFLFSFRNGWFIYTPVILFAFAGLFFLYKRNKKIFMPVIAYTFINLWIVSSWTVWWYGNCFSQRGIIASYILLSVPMGYLFVEINTKRNILKYSMFGIVLFLVALNLFQSWQTANGILVSSRASGKYWLATFGKTTASPNNEKLLYMDWPTNGIENFTNESDYTKTHTWELGFEESEGMPKEKLNTEIFHSGKSSYVFDSITEFGPAIEKKYSEITDKYHAWIRVSVWVYPVSDTKKYPACIVTTFTHQGKSYKYKGTGTDQLNLEINKWNRITFDYLTPMAVRSKNDPLSVYIWNNGKGKIFVDDLQVEVFEPKFDPSIF